MVAEAIAATDWRALDAQIDADMAAKAANGPDAPPILTGDGTAAAIASSSRSQT